VPVGAPELRSDLTRDLDVLASVHDQHRHRAGVGDDDIVEGQISHGADLIHPEERKPVTDVGS
jgi:hypothetical protein